MVWKFFDGDCDAANVKNLPEVIPRRISDLVGYSEKGEGVSDDKILHMPLTFSLLCLK